MTAVLDGRRALAFAAVIVLMGSATFWWSRAVTPAAAPPAVPVVPVAVVSVVRADVPHVTTGIGTVQALANVVIRPQLDGILTSLNFREGQQVRRGDLLATLDDRAPSAALQSAVAGAMGSGAELDSARLDLQRYEDAVGNGAIPRQTLERQRALVRQLEAAVAVSGAEVAAARVTMAHTRISSPIAGRTGIRRVDVGNLVRASDSAGLVTVSQLDPIAILFSLPQDYLSRVRALASQGSAGVKALDRVGGDLLAEGLVVTIDNAVDAATGTIRLKAEFANPEGRLWPGQFVTVQLTTGISRNALTIPASALLRGRDQNYVYRVRDGIAAVAPVTLEYETEAVAVVATGLAAGDLVISDGQSRVRPGNRVKVVGPGTASRPAQPAPPS